MRAGMLRDRVRIERKSATQDSSYGSEVVSWVEHATLAAGISDVGWRERITANVRVGVRTSVIRTRYVAGVTSDMRVVDLASGRVMNIVGLKEYVARNGLELTCEDDTVA